MHQTFYIDIDEEITSIIERLKKAQTKEIILVVPKRALLIQSIVNLKILKKEADESSLQLMIVTQDKLGKILVEKAGILVQQKIDNIADEEISLDDSEAYGAEQKEYPDKRPDDISIDKQNRLDKIGSKEYFDEDGSKDDAPKEINKEKVMYNLDKKTDQGENIREEIINKELVAPIGSNLGNKKVGINMDLKSRVAGSDNASSYGFPKKNEPKIDISAKALGGENHSEIKNNFNPRENFWSRQEKADFSSETPVKENKKIEKFLFSQNSLNASAKPKDNYKNYNLSNKVRKWFLVFGLILVVLIAGVLTYLFLPKASITISTKTKTKSIDSEIVGDLNINSLDYEKGAIPTKLVEIEEELSKSFDSTGNKSVSNQKARGKVIIYNEYGSSPQPLVATTRLLTEDGKLFRLVQGVTVPGTQKKDGKIEPGQIEADVVADQSGEEFNINPAKFSIPGFKDSGSEKYNKFYAKSTENMTGGGTSGENASSITEEDIASAKSGVLSELEERVKEKIKESAGADFIVLDDAISKEEAVYKLSNSAGEVASSFKVSIIMKAKTFVFNEKDIKKIAANMAAKAGGGREDIDNETVSLDFGKSDSNFNEGTINIKFHANGNIRPDINLDEIKTEILGKNEKYLESYLAEFSDIEKVEVEYWPSIFRGRIPFQKSRVSVIME